MLMLLLIRDVKGLGMGIFDTHHVRKKIYWSCIESPASTTKICQLVDFSDTICVCVSHLINSLKIKTLQTYSSG